MTTTLAADSATAIRRPASNVLPAALVGAIALVWNFWRVGTPSLWRDEFFTAYIAGAGPDGIFHVANKLMDRIHAAYYLVMWVWTQAFGMSEISLRAPSVIAMAIATVALFLLARRYTTVAGSLVAAGIFLALPSTIQYAQEARSYAFVVAGVVVATLLMHVAVERGGWTWWAGYAAALTFAALFSFISLLILIAHAAYMWRRAPKAAALAWAPSLIVGLGIAIWSSQQAKQVSWIAEPTTGQLWTAALRLAGTAPAALLTLAPIVGLLIFWRSHAWLLVAASLPVVLWVASHVEPMFIPRYILWVVPFYALIAAIVATRFHVAAAVVFLIVLGLLTFPAQMQVRGSDGHGDDFRSAQRFITEQAQSGDAVAFDTEPARMGYEHYNQQPAAVADPLKGAPNWGFMPTNKPCATQALAGINRVWEVQLAKTRIPACGTNLHLTSTTWFGDVAVNLYE